MSRPAETPVSPAVPAAGLLQQIDDGVDLRTACILVVDDSLVTRELMRGCLVEAGFANILLACDGREALDLAAAHRPDLVILDLAMPVLDGFETCSELRRREDTRDVPVLVQTATEKLSDVTRAFEVGANDILGKPFKPFELISRARVHLHNRMMLKRLLEFRHRVARELDDARAMQQFLCPDPTVLEAASRRHQVEIGSIYRPSSEVGGDIWGLLENDDQLCVYLADFAGHGVAAALNTFRLHTMISRLAPDVFEPERILAELNDALCNALGPGQFATLTWACLDRRAGILSYATAGSPPPLIWRAGQGDIPVVGAGAGLPLGFVQGVEYTRHEVEIGAGLRFFLFSDAAIEARDAAGLTLAEEGLRHRAARHASLSGEQEFVEALSRDLNDPNGFQTVDDLTMVTLAVRR